MLIYKEVLIFFLERQEKLLVFGKRVHNFHQHILIVIQLAGFEFVLIARIEYCEFGIALNVIALFLILALHLALVSSLVVIQIVNRVKSRLFIFNKLNKISRAYAFFFEILDRGACWLYIVIAVAKWFEEFEFTLLDHRAHDINLLHIGARVRADDVREGVGMVLDDIVGKTVEGADRDAIGRRTDHVCQAFAH